MFTRAQPAALHRLSDLPAKPAIGKSGPIGRDHFPVEPSRAIAADLLVKAGGRQDAHADVGAVPREIVGLTAIEEIGGNAPVIRVDPLDMAGPAQRLQPPDMRADECLGLAADAVDGGTRPLQMRGWG